LATLAAAYAEAGQFDNAVKYQMKTLEDSNPDWLDFPLMPFQVDKYRRCLELYKQNKPYRETTW